MGMNGEVVYSFYAPLLQFSRRFYSGAGGLLWFFLSIFFLEGVGEQEGV